MVYKMTEEHKKKIGKANKKGHFIKCFNCRKKVYVTPYDIKRKTPKKYCNRDCFKEYYKKHFSKRGKDNIFWKKGCLAFLKRRVKERDNWTCKECNLFDKDIMEVHHIKERCKGGKDNMKNLQTLCPNCHARKTYKLLRDRKKKK